MLVQIQCIWETWIGQHMNQLLMGLVTTRALQRAEGHDLGGFVPRRLTESESIRESAEMMERFHRTYLRTVRTLKELKRQTPSVVVQQAGQVNVGEQQVNVSQARE